jgi:predicted transcriptional regulator
MQGQIDYKEIIRSWKWRIVKTGHNQTSFANEIDILQSHLSEYLSFKRNVGIERFFRIENKLRELEFHTAPDGLR